VWLFLGYASLRRCWNSLELKALEGAESSKKDLNEEPVERAKSSEQVKQPQAASLAGEKMAVKRQKYY